MPPVVPETKIGLRSGNDDKKFIRFKIVKFEERDVSGNLLQYVEDCSQNFSFFKVSEPINTTFNNIPVQKIEYRTSGVLTTSSLVEPYMIKPSVNVNITLYYFQKNAVLNNYQGISGNMLKNQGMYEIKVSSFPFSCNKNKLVMGLQITGEGGPHRISNIHIQSHPTRNDVKRIYIGPGLIDLPKTAVLFTKSEKNDATSNSMSLVHVNYMMKKYTNELDIICPSFEDNQTLVWRACIDTESDSAKNMDDSDCITFLGVPVRYWCLLALIIIIALVASRLWKMKKRDNDKKVEVVGNGEGTSKRKNVTFGPNPPRLYF